MLFRVYDHYCDLNEKQLDLFVSHCQEEKVIDNSSLSIKEPEDCFICYEYKSEKELLPIQLKNQSIYEKICHCDGWIHNECLEKWVNMHNQCPICRIIVIEDEPDDIIMVRNNNNESRFRIFCRKLGKAIIITIKIYSALFFLFILFTQKDIYNSIINVLSEKVKERNNINITIIFDD